MMTSVPNQSVTFVWHLVGIFSVNKEVFPYLEVLTLNSAIHEADGYNLPPVGTVFRDRPTFTA